MRYLGLDFGLATVGLAIAAGPLAEPLGQKKYKHLSQLLDYLTRLCQEQGVDIIIIGLSENAMAQKTKAFAVRLAAAVNLPIKYQDETLTTKQAQQKLIASHTPQKKRRHDHQFAATLILQAYLDTLPQA